jgi:transcription termination factor Rho
MAEGNEQPALLGDESEKKPKRSRSAPGSSAKRAPARKTGGKRPTKSNHLGVAEPSQGQLLETAGRPSNEGNSEIKAADGSVRHAADHSVTKNEGARPEEKPIASHRTNAALEVAENPEVAPAENGRHRIHSEIAVEQPKPEPVYGEGLIEVSGKGFGFLRDPKRNYVQSPQDIFVTPEVVRKHALRDGLWIKGEIRRGSRGPQLFKLTEINGEDPERYRNLPVFEELTSINPIERIRLETVPDRYTTRVMDLMTPIGKGQRGLIVAPPRTGKTTLLQHIADAVVRNHPETSLIILLVDERPEEVTEIRRTVPKADIMASSNDSDIKSHTRIAQLAIERAKRLVEANRDVFVLMDSLTRVGRAFNNASAGSGRTMSGGMDSRAMEIPRKLFAAARNTEEAGSLTIMATALIETGSKMDELIFQEFKGTGNMEMVLDRQISDQRTYPSVDIFKSGTRREELLLAQKDLEKINTIRRGLAGHRPTEAIERLLSFLRKFPTNAQMLREIPG